MEEEILISAMSLFADVSLMPAVFLILRDREALLAIIQFDQWHGERTR